MKGLFVDCPTGLAGDMILSGLLDLGVPLSVVESSLNKIGLENKYRITSESTTSYGFRGLRISVLPLESEPPKRLWHEIKNQIMSADISQRLRGRIYKVFQSLAEAEAKVHGESIEMVHFHEIGAIDSLVDIVGVCAAIEYINPSEIICAIPNVGCGKVDTSHGELSVPVPAVLELARKYQLEISYGANYSDGELTTPTGLALMAVLADRFTFPSSVRIRRIGIGLGHRSLGRPNFLRACEFSCSDLLGTLDTANALVWQSLIIQEAWIDDLTPEDVSGLTTQLRDAGAIDVACHPVQMKKGRQGINLTVLMRPENAPALRYLWLEKGITLGLRERLEGRWVLPRRIGTVPSKWGPIKAKQTRRPSGAYFLKLEHDDLMRISLETGLHLEEIRREASFNLNEFSADNEWTC